MLQLRAIVPKPRGLLGILDRAFGNTLQRFLLISLQGGGDIHTRVVKEEGDVVFL